MAIKPPTNIINSNIRSTYDIDQQLESKEENERKHTKIKTHYNLIDYNFLDNFHKSGCDVDENAGAEVKNENQEEIFINPKFNGKMQNKSKYQEYDVEQEFKDSEEDKKRNKNQNEKTKQINNELILSKFDDKILNEMALIYIIENEDEIKIIVMKIKYFLYFFLKNIKINY